jgi:molybdate transport system substrate-binding protein
VSRRKIVRLLPLQLLGILSFTALTATPASADNLNILAAGAVAQVVRTLAADFERRSGIHVIVENATAGAIEKRIRGGAAFDVAVVSDGVLDRLSKDGHLDAASGRGIARVGIGIAVKQGAPVPAIATVEQFKKALLDAPSVAMIDPKAGGSSGIYLEGLFGRLGIAQQMHAKEVLVPGGLVAEKLIDGTAVIAMQQESELLLVKGAHLVGPLPASIQNYTGYAGAVSAHSHSPVAARAFLTMFAGADTHKAMTEHGLRPGAD